MNLVNCKSGNEFSGEDLLGGEVVDDFRNVELWMRFQKFPHLPAAVGLANVVALLGQLYLHVLHDAVDEKS